MLLAQVKPNLRLCLRFEVREAAFREVKMHDLKLGRKVHRGRSERFQICGGQHRCEHFALLGVGLWGKVTTVHLIADSSCD